MITDPTKIIGEVLGQPAAQMRNPANAEYLCPFINSVCTKKGHFTTGPYPVCSVWTKPSGGRQQKLVCTCPRRFFEADIFRDVVDHCWVGPKPANPRASREVSMKGFGQVDFVVADVDEQSHKVREFISVETQAVDLTGSVEPAYSALINNGMLDASPGYGFNWANVRKRYISQLIATGFFHHHWGTRIVAVLQTPVYDEFRKYIHFTELPAEQGNIVFLLYDFDPAPQLGEGMQSLSLKRVVATDHSSLMTGVLYRTPPQKTAFCAKILQNLQWPRRKNSKCPTTRNRHTPSIRVEACQKCLDRKYDEAYDKGYQDAMERFT